MMSPAYEALSEVEKIGYETFIADQKIDFFGMAKGLEHWTLLISGWYVAAREAFAEGAVCACTIVEYGRTNEPKNPYPTGTKVLYDCNENYAGAEGYHNIPLDMAMEMFLPRAYQWHCGFIWQMAQ